MPENCTTSIEHEIHHTTGDPLAKKIKSPIYKKKRQRKKEKKRDHGDSPVTCDWAVNLASK
jgi:hypothetical protein